MQLDNIASFSPGSMLPCITSEKRRISKRNSTIAFKTIFLARGFETNVNDYWKVQNFDIGIWIISKQLLILEENIYIPNATADIKPYTCT